MTCTHTTTDGLRNHCDLYGMMDRRVCFYCPKNTQRGVWPAEDTVPKVPVVKTPHQNHSPISLDPAVRATIARQHGGCKGCGDSPLGGI